MNWYQERKAQGKCTRKLTCDNPVVPGQVTCAQCRDEHYRTRKTMYRPALGNEPDERCAQHGGNDSPRACDVCLGAERALRVEALRIEDYAGGLSSWWWHDTTDEAEAHRQANKRLYEKRRKAKIASSIGEAEYRRRLNEYQKAYYKRTRASAHLKRQWKKEVVTQ